MQALTHACKVRVQFRRTMRHWPLAAAELKKVEVRVLRPRSKKMWKGISCRGFEDEETECEVEFGGHGKCTFGTP